VIYRGARVRKRVYLRRQKVVASAAAPVICCTRERARGGQRRYRGRSLRSRGCHPAPGAPYLRRIGCQRFGPVAAIWRSTPKRSSSSSGGGGGNGGAGRLSARLRGEQRRRRAVAHCVGEVERREIADQVLLATCWAALQYVGRAHTARTRGGAQGEYSKIAR